MTGGTSQSCFGLVACVGSVIRQIVLCEGSPDRGRALGLAWQQHVDRSRAPRLDVSTRFSRSARRDRHLPGDGQRKPASSGAIAAVTTLAGLPVRASWRSRAQPQLRLPGDLADRPRSRRLAERRLTADPRREAAAPDRLDQQSTDGAVAGLGQTAAFDAGSAPVRDKPSAGADWQSARGRPTRRRGWPHRHSAMPRIVCSAATGGSVQSASIVSICAVSRSRRAAAASTAAM